MALEIERPKTTTGGSEGKESTTTSPMAPEPKAKWDPHHLTGLIADRNLYLGKDGAVVHDTPPSGGATLLAAKGGNIPPDVVKKHRLTLEGDKVVQGKAEKGEDGAPIPPAADRPNEGQLDDGTPLIKVIRTGVLRPEPAPENPAVALEEELKAKNPEPGSAEAKAAESKKAAAKTPAKKTTIVKPGKARRPKGK